MLNDLLGRDLNIDFTATVDKDLSPMNRTLNRRKQGAGKNPTVKEAQITIEQADNVARLAKSSISPTSDCRSITFALRVTFVPTNVWPPASSSAGSLGLGTPPRHVNEKTITIEQSKLDLTIRRTKCWWMWTNNSAG